MNLKTAIAHRLLPVTHLLRNWKAVRAGTRPGSLFFQQELQHFLGVGQEWLEETALEYHRCRAAWKNLSGYRSPSRFRDGFCKTLDVAEGFAAWALVKHFRPRVVVELGTQYGVSARLWKEALKRYVPDHALILCDLEDQRRFIDDGDCSFLAGDARETLKEVMALRQVDLIFNDAHPVDLIRWSVEEGLKAGVRLFAFHDVGSRHPRHPFQLGAGGPRERHVMAEVFSPEVLHLDQFEDDSFRIQIFDSLLGLGVVARK